MLHYTSVLAAASAPAISGVLKPEVTVHCQKQYKCISHISHSEKNFLDSCKKQTLTGVHWSDVDDVSCICG